jgi:hypothetical protein
MKAMKNKSLRKYWIKSPQTHRLWNAMLNSTSAKLIMILILSVLLSACGEQAVVNPDYFIPPTLSHAATEIPLATPTEIQPTATPYCENDLTFIEDVNYPDNTEVAPGTLVDKIWLVENSGSCSWDSLYRIRFVEGTNMDAELEQALFPARAGGQAQIQISFVAPAQTGINFSTWQAYTPDGQPFGDQFYLQIVVNPNLEPDEAQGP